MRPRIVGTIFRKDLLDAIRDSRVLVSVFLPVLIGVFYNFAFQDEQRTNVTLAYASPGSTVLPATLQRALPPTFLLKIEEVASADEVRARVRSDAHVGLVLPLGFDQAVAAGQSPELTIVTREQPTGGQNTLVLALDGVLRGMAGQRPPATASLERVRAERETPLVAELGLRRYFVLSAIVMLAGFVALIVIPIILAEEVERRTMDALTLVARTAEVVAAKALVGIAYTFGSLALLLAVTRLVPADLPLFLAAVLALAVGLVGFGLLLGGIFKTSGQAYTWSGFFLIPVIMPPFFLASELARPIETLVLATPTAQATRVMANAVTGKAIFPDLATSFLIMGFWTVAAYALLIWRLRRNTE